jgi:Domain of unknown function (DUF397)
MAVDVAAHWRRSTFCNSSDCVEVAIENGVVNLRDSKSRERHAPVLRYTPAEWQAFVRGVKAGEFDF